MATVDECRQALLDLSERMAANAAGVAERIDLDRPLACTLRDLDTSFHGRLVNGRIEDLADGDDPRAKIRLTTSSDDLIALVTGQLDFARAWTSGRVSVKGNPFDLLKLRKLM